MSLVFPNALAAKTTNLALARGSFWFGMVCLAAVFVSLALIQADRGTARAWLVFVAIALIALSGVLVAVAGERRVWLVVAAAGLALVAIIVYASVLLPNLRAFDSSDSILLSLPKVAIVVFGAVVGPHLSGLVGVGVALAIAEIPVAFLSVATGHAYAIDVPVLACAALLLLIIGLLRVSRKRTRASEPLIALAEQEDRDATELARAEHLSSALVHDTILNELAVVATVAPGTLSDRARAQIARSLEMRRVDDEHVAEVAADVLGGDVAAAVEEARALGLDVSVAGEVAAVESLDARTSVALGLAVLQCLTNVAAHAGTDAAELTIVSTDDAVCVMVVDFGVGFVEAELHADRLGLRHSVRGRIADVGGSVQVWSAPGAGTAVSLMVPRS
jgi:two-component sensor histidine kinase